VHLRSFENHFLDKMLNSTIDFLDISKIGI